MIREEVIRYLVKHFICLGFGLAHGRDETPDTVFSRRLELAQAGVDMTATWASILAVPFSVHVSSPHASNKMEFDCSALFP